MKSTLPDQGVISKPYRYARPGETVEEAKMRWPSPPIFEVVRRIATERSTPDATLTLLTGPWLNILKASLSRRRAVEDRRVCDHPAVESEQLMELREHGRRFPPNYLHESWADYLYWDSELEP